METLIELDAAFPWFFPATVFVFGAIVGSFLNVCIYRIPAGRSIVTPGSACACGHPIAWYDNVPIVSWLILRGRARCCGRRFSVRYPAIELLTALLFWLCWLAHPPAVAAAGMLLIGSLVCATFIDLDHMIIPDRFTIGAAVAGVVISVLVPRLHGFDNDIFAALIPSLRDPASDLFLVDALRAAIVSITGVLVGSGLILWVGLIGEVVLRKEAMGFGDVKFLGAIGAFLGWQGGIFSIFAGAVIGTVAFALIWLWHGLFGRRKPAPTAPPAQHESAVPGSDNTGASDALAADSGPGAADGAPPGFGQHTPFGPMLAAGALVYLLWAGPYVDAYFRAITEVLFKPF